MLRAYGGIDAGPWGPVGFPFALAAGRCTIDVGTPAAEILAGLLAFALGGTPFGWLAAKAFRGVDLRRVGSGNIGATNASRLFPKAWSIVAFVGVFLLDFAKGFCAAFFAARLGAWLGSDAPAQTVKFVCGAAVILGHVFSPYLSFKGGKGVATTLGVVAAVAPWWSMLAAVGAWGILVGLTRYVSLGSVGAMLTLPLAYLLGHGGDVFKSRLASFLFLLGLAAMVVWRHHSNIARLLAGRERKVGAADQL